MKLKLPLALHYVLSSWVLFISVLAMPKLLYSRIFKSQSFLTSIQMEESSSSRNGKEKVLVKAEIFRIIELSMNHNWNRNQLPWLRLRVEIFRTVKLSISKIVVRFRMNIYISQYQEIHDTWLVLNDTIDKEFP